MFQLARFALLTIQWVCSE